MLNNANVHVDIMDSHVKNAHQGLEEVKITDVFLSLMKLVHQVIMVILLLEFPVRFALVHAFKVVI